jgi:Domain of unknown function (DUF1905)/Bacteriocin-protection, YdeI or OmpD-Associated
LRFTAEVLSAGKTATGVEVPAKVVEQLGSKRPKVRVTINGYTYRSSIAPMSGTFMLGISAEVREQAGVAAGDRVDVELELDTAPREVTTPADLAKAFKKEPAAKRAFEDLSYSRKRWYVEGIEGAKKPETRQRRVEKAIDDLRKGAT